MNNLCYFCYIYAQIKYFNNGNHRDYQPYPVYNYRALESFFEEISDPQETANHLGHLLHFLFYYQREQNIEDYYHIYSEIFELQQILLGMKRTDEEDTRQTGEHGSQEHRPAIAPRKRPRALPPASSQSSPNP